jgi:hypothetical protein
MFDGFKLLLINQSIDFEKYEFESKTNKTNSDGELIKSSYYDKGIYFQRFKSGTILIRGSFHIYFNDGLHNYNDFTFSNFKDVVEEMCLKYSLNPINCILQNIEYGVNLSIKYNVDEVLSNLLFHKGKTPCKDLDTSYIFRHSNFRLKIYNKSLQYKRFGIEDNIIRFENAIQRSVELPTYIISLEDLTVRSNLKCFNVDLLEKWSEVLLNDFTLNKSTLKTRDKLKLMRYSNSRYWQETLSNRRHRPKKHFKELIMNHSENVHEYIYKEIEKKTSELCNN